MKSDLYDPIEEDVKTGLECIAYQITDLTLRMAQDANLPLSELHADGGPTANKYLMQFQSDIAQVTVSVSDVQSFPASVQRAQQGFPADYMTRRRSLRTRTAAASHRRWIIPSAKHATMAGRKPCGKH